MIELLRPSGDFLQIGFGKKNIASKCIAFHPKRYTLIESDPFELEKAKEWMKHHPHVTLLAELWQNALPSLGLFDTIYCELTEMGGLWPDLARFRYTDHDLEILSDSAAKTSSPQLFRFLHELSHNGQITEEQRDKMIGKYKLEGEVPKIKKSCRQMVACLKLCLDAHMRKGSRFAAPLDLSIAYDDPLFVQIATDPFVEIRDAGDGIVVEKFGP